MFVLQDSLHDSLAVLVNISFIFPFLIWFDFFKDIVFMVGELSNRRACVQ